MNRPGLLQPVALISVLLVAPFAACRSWEMNQREFRSVTAWEKADAEPQVEDYQQQVRVYPVMSRLLFGALGREQQVIDNPSAKVRELLLDLTEQAEGDLLREAEVLRYALWVLSTDPSAYNRVAALRGVGILLERLAAAGDLDPMDAELYVRGLSAAAERELEQRVLQAYGDIDRLFGRGEVPLASADRAAYRQAIGVYAAQPLPRRRQQRDALRLFWSLAGFERDTEIAALARQALRRCMVYAALNGLRAALVPDAYSVDDFPDVRLCALRIYRRMGGTAAVPFLLYLLKRPGAVQVGRTIDRDPQVVLLLVRYSAQLRFELATRSYQGGPRPIDLLYELAVDTALRRDIQATALEGLALCLGPGRAPSPLPEDATWAREWWAGFIKQDEGR